nr:MAG TPA: hypothetical protein [Caudoviricetes sp.]
MKYLYYSSDQIYIHNLYFLNKVKNVKINQIILYRVFQVYVHYLKTAYSDKKLEL